MISRLPAASPHGTTSALRRATLLQVITTAGQMNLVAGSPLGVAGYTDATPGTAGTMDGPHGLVLSSDGASLYFCDQ